MTRYIGNDSGKRTFTGDSNSDHAQAIIQQFLVLVNGNVSVAAEKLSRSILLYRILKEGYKQEIIMHV